jgi:hypothetical protein
MTRLTTDLANHRGNELIAILESIITAGQLCINLISVIFPMAKGNHTVIDIVPGLELVYLNRPQAILDKEEIQLVNSFLLRVTTLPRTERGIRNG